MSNKKLVDETTNKFLDLYDRGDSLDVLEFRQEFLEITKPLLEAYNIQLMELANPITGVIAPILAFALKTMLDIVQQDFDVKDKMIVEALEGSFERIGMKLPEELMF
jgi:hypothetical protein